MSKKDEVIALIKDFLGDENVKITEKTDIRNFLGLSSFDLMELSTEIEDKFSVKLEAEDLANVVTVYDLLKIIG